MAHRAHRAAPRAGDPPRCEWTAGRLHRLVVPANAGTTIECACLEPEAESVNQSLRAAALEALCECRPDVKCAAVAALDAAPGPLDASAVLVEPPGLPGRPPLPCLVAPRQIAQRSVATHAGHAGLVHALAHIEFNAINLALDAIWRFAGMPADYYRDWLRVAAEEAQHFALLRAHLATLGHAYGDFPAHDGLWQMAERTRGDVLARMALVPRTLEARGLDASPLVRAKLVGAGDLAGAAIIDVILRDEIGHVSIGNRWFHALCRARDFDPVATYAHLTEHYQAPRLHGPFNLPARRLAGFLPDELVRLQSRDGVHAGTSSAIEQAE